MRSRRSIPEELRRLASLQAGVATLEQAGAHGVSRYVVDRLVADEDWQRLTRSVFYCHALTPPWPAWAWGGVLLAGDTARRGGQAAGHVLGLVKDPPDPIAVLVRGPRLKAMNSIHSVVNSRYGYPIHSRRAAGDHRPVAA